nr:MAG TPA: NTP-PPase-like protein [Caudoviricetes sp.]
MIFVRGNSSLLTDGLVSELGDVLWFVAMLAQRLGYSLENVMRLNLDKLADRQARGVIIGDGDKR